MWVRWRIVSRVGFVWGLGPGMECVQANAGFFYIEGVSVMVGDQR